LFRPTINDVKFRVSNRVTSDRMNMQFPEILAILNESLGPQVDEILVSKDHDATFCNEK
jgi:hypothetical protein